MAAGVEPEDVPDLSVVISTLGSHDTLARVLAGYEHQDLAAETFEVVVAIDRAEADRGAVSAAIGARPYPVRTVSPERNGLSANRNAGWRAARAEIVLFTDNDTVPRAGLVDEHLRWHRREPDPRIAVIGPVRWSDELTLTPFMRWLDQGIQFDFGSIRGIEATWAHAYGANLSVKRAFIEQVGGYDEERLPYGHEDLDWGYRAREHGLRVLYNRRAVVDHLREMDLEFWKVRAGRVGMTERRFCELHPEVEPNLRRRFSEAAALPPQRGRAARLARFVPRGTPYAGPLVWNLADLYWRQQLAPYFLAGWEGTQDAQPAASAAAERSASSAGSPPRGPK